MLKMIISFYYIPNSKGYIKCEDKYIKIFNTNIPKTIKIYYFFFADFYYGLFRNKTQ